VFALCGLISLLYSSNKLVGLKILERHVSFLFLPFVFYHLQRNIKLTHKALINLLGTSVFLAFVYSLWTFNREFGFYKIYSESVNAVHFVNTLRHYKFQLQHPSYLSYLLLIYLIFLLSHISPLKLNALHIINSIFSTIFIFFLSSRAALLTLLILFVYFLLKSFKQSKYYLTILLVFLILSSGYIILNYTRLGDTIENIINQDSNQKDARLIIWSHSLEVIKKKPIFGYGIGDALDVLISKHEEKNYEVGVSRSLDAHNQFLETWMQSGVFGLIALIAVFWFPFRQSVRQKQEILFLFLAVSFIQLLFESMFIRLAGVVYFSFFYSYLYYVHYRDSEIGN
jgi:O-antigen ligase